MFAKNSKPADQINDH